MFHTMVYKYLRRNVPTSAAISVSVRGANVGYPTAPTGTKPTSRDTSAKLAAVSVLPSLVRRLLFSKMLKETSDSTDVEARNYDNPSQSICKTDGKTSPLGNSRKPSLIA